MYLNTNITMKYGGEPVRQEKPNSSLGDATYSWIVFG